MRHCLIGFITEPPQSIAPTRATDYPGPFHGHFNRRYQVSVGTVENSGVEGPLIGDAKSGASMCR